MEFLYHICKAQLITKLPPNKVLLRNNLYLKMEGGFPLVSLTVGAASVFSLLSHLRKYFQC